MVPASAFAVAVPSPVPRTVVLEHTLPDGSRHFDWLMEPAEPGPDATDEDRSLLAFRLAARVDAPSIVSFLAEAMPDHVSTATGKAVEKAIRNTLAEPELGKMKKASGSHAVAGSGPT